MIRASAFTLVAAGASREHIRPEHIIPDSAVVTVNRAIDVADRGIRVHFSAFADPPRNIWEPLGMQRYVEKYPDIQLWVSLRREHKKTTLLELLGPKALSLSEEERNAPKFVEGAAILHLWDRILPAYVGLRELPYGQVEDVDNPKCMRQAFTTLCALEKIFMFRPERIRILCADMIGPWIDGKTEEECRQHEILKVANNGGTVLDRWRHERTALERSIAKAKKEWPVEVEFLMPLPLPVPCG